MKSRTKKSIIKNHKKKENSIHEKVEEEDRVSKNKYKRRQRHMKK